MRSAKVLYKGNPAGILTQNDDGGFHFIYDELWLSDPSKPPVSLTLPKNKIECQSESLFPFLYHLLPEGANKKTVCKTFKIDENDAFGILLQTSKTDTIGAITLQKI